jgi:HEAT repeat protein
MAAFPSHFHFSPESDLLTKALASDQAAIESAIEQLSSAYPGIRQRMLEAVHKCADDKIWTHLLNCFAFGKWSDNLPFDVYGIPGAAHNLDVSIVDAFMEDCSPAENDRKSSHLEMAIHSKETKLRYGAAYLAGLRGNPAALAILEEMLQAGDHLWQLRAIQALSAIKENKSAELLVQIMVRNHEQFHQEARRGLAELGNLSESAWLETLNNPDPHIRWHAARGLAEIGNTSALQILAQGLCDENQTVRWVTSDLLAHIGAKAIPDILKLILSSSYSDESRQAAFHALRGIKSYRASECLKPLVSALSSPSTKQIAQIIAERMLNDWNHLEGYISGRISSLESMH